MASQLVPFSTPQLLRGRRENAEQMAKVEQLIAKMMVDTPPTILKSSHPDHERFKFVSAMSEITFELDRAKELIPDSLHNVKSLVASQNKAINYLVDLLKKEVMPRQH